MFAARYFCPRHFAPRYFPKVGADSPGGSTLLAKLQAHGLFVFCGPGGVP